ncbi:MAG TPA: hypothetical protein ENN29_00870 [Candidatus Hydrogenedentes bacterium]|nr:hypothetical protein [Candidatus Hydrogenedentota bacterium]
MNNNDNASQPFISPIRARRRYWLHILLAFIILVCGVIIGSGATIYFFSTRIIAGLQNIDEFPMRASEQMRYRLGLDKEQTSKIRAILEERKERYAEFITNMQSYFAEELQSLEKEITPLLTPEQLKIWKNRMIIRKILPPPPKSTEE